MIKGAGNFNAITYIRQSSIFKVGVVSLVTYVFLYKVREFGRKLGQKSMLLHIVQVLGMSSWLEQLLIRKHV